MRCVLVSDQPHVVAPDRFNQASTTANTISGAFHSTGHSCTYAPIYFFPTDRRVLFICRENQSYINSTTYSFQPNLNSKPISKSYIFKKEFFKVMQLIYHDSENETSEQRNKESIKSLRTCKSA